jgi:hypothetical protein
MLALRGALLAILRFSQGLGLGGEWSGAALLAAETAEPESPTGERIWKGAGARAEVCSYISNIRVTNPEQLNATLLWLGRGLNTAHSLTESP